MLTLCSTRKLKALIFSILAISILCSKFLHLFQHASSVKWYLLALYFPTFFLQEFFLSVAVWLLLYQSSGFYSKFATAFAGLLAYVARTTDCLQVLILYRTTVLLAAASQIGFFFITGGEVRWDTARLVGSGREGRKMLLSGLRPVLVAGTIILILSRLLMHAVHMLMMGWFSRLSIPLAPAESDVLLPVDEKQKQPSKRTTVWTACVVSLIFAEWLVRPTVPYKHLSGALPFTLLAGVQTLSTSRHAETRLFPFPGLLKREYWELPNGHYKGWAPEMDDITRYEYARSKPAWLTDAMPPGFRRWAITSETNLTRIDAPDGMAIEDNTGATGSGYHYYDPVKDPIRITNLDMELLEPLQTALRDHDIPITHIFMVLMESTREDVFPFKAGSHLHDEVLHSYQTEDTDILAELEIKLSRLTPVAEMITGETSRLSGTESVDPGLRRLWKTKMGLETGGINVAGLLTGSTLSRKSMVVDLCGAGPLAVDHIAEVEAEIYQPCITRILELFNQDKFQSRTYAEGSPGTNPEDIRERQWKTAFAQSTTGDFDNLREFNQMMGFNQSLYSEDIDDPDAKYFHQDMEWSGYWGYPETELLPYLRDIIEDALQNDNRLFLTHFTSSTHHPFSLPEDFPHEQYFADTALTSKYEDINNYFNAVHYLDCWLGDLMNLLHETGIANETLVVFIGDHGYPVEVDAPNTIPYENGHISNFRIPLVFYHPLLPRMQVTANATSISVLPTILDLLVSTKSLNEEDSDIALDLMNEYEGQSLIRPYKETHNGRQAWNIGVINRGGTMLSVGSAAMPYRLILPLKGDKVYTFTNVADDPYERSPLDEWELADLINHVRSKYGHEAATWAADAEKMGRWWVDERKRLWNYHDAP